MSTPGGPSRVRASSAGVVHRRPQALGGVARADEDAARPREALARVRAGSAGSGLTVYSSALPWTFTAYGTPSPARGPGRRAHHEVVGERDVRPHARGDLAHGGDVRVEVGVELLVGELRERLGLDALVAVGHVDRQQAADVGPVDRRARRLAAGRRPRARPPSQSPAASTKSSSNGSRSWQSRCTSWPARTSAAASSAL